MFEPENEKSCIACFALDGVSFARSPASFAFGGAFCASPPDTFARTIAPCKSCSANLAWNGVFCALSAETLDAARTLGVRSRL